MQNQDNGLPELLREKATLGRPPRYFLFSSPNYQLDELNQVFADYKLATPFKLGGARLEPASPTSPSFHRVFCGVPLFNWREPAGRAERPRFINRSSSPTLAAGCSMLIMPPPTHLRDWLWADLEADGAIRFTKHPTHPPPPTPSLKPQTRSNFLSPLYVHQFAALY